MQQWIGTSGFQYKEWKGKFYPEDLPVSKMLKFYSERFTSTEINYTFRQIPSEKTLLNWSNSTPPNFKFSLKGLERITHGAQLRDCEEILGAFTTTITALGDKLGPILFQLPPWFRKDCDRLSTFLKTIPEKLRVTFEFRHESWFDEEVFAVLRGRNAALCIAESEDLVTPAVATADFGYLRLRRQDYTPQQIRKWGEVVGSNKGKWSDVFIYFKHEEAGVGPEFAREMVESLKP